MLKEGQNASLVVLRKLWFQHCRAEKFFADPGRACSEQMFKNEKKVYPQIEY